MEKILGKTSVVAKDTPAYWKRIGIWNSKFVSLGKRNGITIEEVDKLTGPVIGRPKSATLEL
jgi:3-hydroxyacyl-CoA dehydrogenase